ncbi:hypothetical protein [Parathalassolituus penaei]|uniref:Carboxypeptidase regulatory-like domain-containing protein n=1 Tax=Parathalassolituus penaei TaxID=2997323 RepID=A0A9X3ELU1_9GAMM|nr:hypothetical protein [Parathalassolituus penaei]MCY0964993.1 hypothetical protein [Parathalassolituus penaei]
MNTRKNYLWAVIASTSLAMAACGGGGSKSDDNNSGGNNGGTTVNRVSLTGLAVKGVMAGADIKVTSLDGQTSYGTTTTSSDGTYSLAAMDIPLNTPVLVTMTTNASTLLTCDAAAGCMDGDTLMAFGQKYTYHDPDFKMTALLAGVSTETASASLMVTPLTNMAAERAQQEGKTSSSDIAAINRATATLLGLDNVDIATVVPADITNSSAVSSSNNAQRYGAVVAAIANVATNKGQSLSTVVSELAASYARQGGLVANSSDEAEVDLEDIFGGAADSAASANLSAIAVEYSLEEQTASNSAEDELVAADEGSPDSGTLTEEEQKALAVTNAVALLQDLNNWHNDLKDVSADPLVNTLNSEGDELAALVETIATNSELATTVQNLLLDTEEYEYCDEWGWDDNAGDYICSVPTTVTMTVPGPVVQGTELLVQLVSLAPAVLGYVLASEGEDASGSFDMTLEDVGVPDELMDEFEDGGANLTISATLVSGQIVAMSMTGASSYATITSLAVALSEPASGDRLVASLSNVNISAIEGDKHMTGSGSISLIFDSADSLAAFKADDSAADGLVSMVMDLNTEAMADDGLDSVANLDLHMEVTPDASSGTATMQMSAGLSAGNSSNDSMAGTLMMSASSNDWLVFENLSQTEMSFEGALTIASAEGSASFEGTIGMLEVYPQDSNADAVMMVATDGNEDYTQLTFDGGFSVVSGTDTTMFSGQLKLREDYLHYANGDYVTDSWGDDVTVPTLVELQGEFSAVRNSVTMGSLAVHGMAQLSNLQELAAMLEPDTLSDAEFGVLTASADDEVVAYDTVNNSLTVTLDSGWEEIVSAVTAEFEAAGWTNISLDGWYYDTSYQLTMLDCIEVDTEYSECNIQIESDRDIDLSNNIPDAYYDSWETTVTVLTANIASPAAWADEVIADVGLSDYWQAEISFYVNSDQGTAEVYGYSDYYDDEPVAVWSLETYDDTSVTDQLLSAETLDTYLDFAFALDIQASAVTYDDAVVRLVGERTGFADAAGTLRLSYGDRVIDINVDTANQEDSSTTSISIANADASMTITASCASGSADTSLTTCDSADVEFGGAIYSGGFEVGTLEVRNGLPVFLFDNGSSYNLVVTPQFLVSANQ